MLTCFGAVRAQDRPLERIFISNSTLSESRAPLYIAQDLKLFEQFGLDARLVNIRGSAINNASLMAGEIQMAVAKGRVFRMGEVKDASLLKICFREAAWVIDIGRWLTLRSPARWRTLPSQGDRPKSLANCRKNLNQPVIGELESKTSLR